jgi:hypothetical protein
MGGGFTAQLVLPYDLSESEAVWLNALILTLVVPEAPSVAAAQGDRRMNTRDETRSAYLRALTAPDRTRLRELCRRLPPDYEPHYGNGDRMEDVEAGLVHGDGGETTYLNDGD